MARIPSIRDSCTSKLPPGLMSHNKGQRVSSFVFGGAIRQSVDLQVRRYASGLSAVAHGAHVPSITANSPSLIFSLIILFLSPNVRHPLTSCLFVSLSSIKQRSSGRDVSDWLPPPRPTPYADSPDRPALCATAVAMSQNGPVPLRPYAFCSGYCTSTAGCC